jgi:hypothetical protein
MVETTLPGNSYDGGEFVGFGPDAQTREVSRWSGGITSNASRTVSEVSAF